MDNQPVLAIVLGDIKASLSWGLETIRKALVAGGYGSYYAVKLIQRDFLAPGIDPGPDVYTPVIRSRDGHGSAKKRSCDIFYLDKLPPELAQMIRDGELTYQH